MITGSSRGAPPRWSLSAAGLANQMPSGDKSNPKPRYLQPATAEPDSALIIK